MSSTVGKKQKTNMGEEIQNGRLHHSGVADSPNQWEKKKIALWTKAGESGD